MFFHKSRERRGIRAWWRFGERACIAVEFYWLSPRFGATLESDDDGWNISLRIPPLALYVSLERLGLWQPIERIYTAPDGTQYPIADRREFDFSVYDWTIRLTPWGRWGEWRAADPWWIRGVSFDVRRFVLGQNVYIKNVQRTEPVTIPMPEGLYRAEAEISMVTRGYSRWFKRTAEEVSLTIPNGIPFAGKGENSWDCGDDGLYGCGGNSVDDAIRQAQRHVADRRQRYGHASPDAVREALQ